MAPSICQARDLLSDVLFILKLFKNEQTSFQVSMFSRYAI